ncbi:hypothetical protein ACN47E_002397 [Coniothyrium glycines]
MAQPPARTHQYDQHLPPSPPPSPPLTRRRHKKKQDPFDQLAPSPASSRPAAPQNESDDDDSLVSKIILTPVLFVSFLLSLFFVNYRNRARRTKHHAKTTSLLTYLTPSTWLDPEPYQDPNNSTWDRKGAVGHVEPHDAIGPRDATTGEPSKNANKKSKPWHFHKKIRKMTKLEISDAFEMRGKVIVGMIVVLLLSSIALWMGLRWALVSLSAALFGAKS